LTLKKKLIRPCPRLEHGGRQGQKVRSELRQSWGHGAFQKKTGKPVVALRARWVLQAHLTQIPAPWTCKGQNQEFPEINDDDDDVPLV
jgi:hypothetical protein